MLVCWPVARRSLRRELNQIRSWVEDGRTDAWIAHQLDISVADLRAFKDEHDLVQGGAPAPPPVEAESLEDFVDEFEEELDQRLEEERAAAEEEAAGEEEATEEEAAEEEEAEEEAGDRKERGAEPGPEEPRRPRRRGGRGRGGGGRGRGAGKKTSYEATFDHGEEGYGLWLDPSVEQDPTYAKHWAGHRAVRVTIEPDAIVIRREGAEEEQAS